MPAASASFPPIQFKGKLRPSQDDVAQIARRKLAEGCRQLHIVAPPGSGKTVLGLYVWAMLVRKPCVVLSPNSAIQAQWAARTDLFEIPGDRETMISTDPTAPGLLTSLTYQSLTLPRGGSEDLDTLARDLWRESLIAKGQAKDPDEADVWIADLARHNRNYHDQRLGAYRKQVRDEAGVGGQSLRMLHASSLAALERLKGAGVGLVILDECHHLLGHWGRVLAAAQELLAQPVILGLTATPPDRDGHLPADVERYDAYFGPVDYEVPVPAVVKDGFLAPYQDLAYFVRPTSRELDFIANADDQLNQLVDDLCRVPSPGEENAAAPPAAPAGGNGGDPAAARVVAKPVESKAAKRARPAAADDLGTRLPAAAISLTTDTSVGDAVIELRPEDFAAPADAEASRRGGPPPAAEPTLPDWLVAVLRERRLPTGRAKDWTSFEKRDPEFALAARCFLRQCHVPQLRDVPPLDDDPRVAELPQINIVVPVLDRYIRHRLRRSPLPADHALAERAIARLRLLGVQVTETGSQACASPVGRVLAYSRAKAEALVTILREEMQALGDKIRAVVVADYEKTSAVTAEIGHLLDDEAGGAVAAFKTLIREPSVDALQPVLVTGSTVLVDDDAAEAFDRAANAWLAQEKCDAQLIYGEEDGFHVLSGQGPDWCPRVYVAMVTELFQRGLTRCLVGTRGLLGEGWDASKINVLIDLTTVTTSMSVNQLRGRSIRLDKDDPHKLANNWDVVCLAPEFTKGLDDYRRFMAKHATLYGVTEDAAIEKGIGHVHPAFTTLRPEGIEGSMGLLNDEMLRRVHQRKEYRDKWRIGQPYHPEPVRAVEARPLRERDTAGFPPFAGYTSPWSGESLTLAIGQAVLGALREAGLVTAGGLHVGARAGGYVRAFLEQASQEESGLFTAALEEALGPLQAPRYVIPRDIDLLEDTWLSSILPEIVGRYFQRRVRRMAMLHAVPSALAKTKELAAIYERHWNQHVSPGKAMFAQRGEGQEWLDRAVRSGLVPRGEVREKEVFL